jgi:hypothetical protein
MTGFDVEKVQDPTTIVSLTGCSRCQVFWFDRDELEQLGLSFDGPVRESMRPVAGNTQPAWPDPYVPGLDIFDGFDFDIGD